MYANIKRHCELQLIYLYVIVINIFTDKNLIHQNKNVKKGKKYY